MKLPDKKTLEQFNEWEKSPPSHEEHNTEDSWLHPLSEKLVQAKCWNWYMEGNLLHCDTDFGPLTQRMPTNVVCIGERNGLPVFKEIA